MGRRRAQSLRRKAVSRPAILAIESLENRLFLASGTAGTLAASRPKVRTATHASTSAYTNYLIATKPGAQPAGTVGPTGLSPARIRHAYGLDNITFAGGTIVGDGSGQTIAIIDAFDNPKFFSSTDNVNYPASDLAHFCAQFGLPQFGTVGGPTFTKLNQTGGTSYPGGNTDWGTEIALDVEWAHAIAPMANILLVEGNDNSLDNLDAAVQFAAGYPGVVVVSMSYGASEFSDESLSDSDYTTPSGHNGVTFLASTGDHGAPGSFPAYSPNVVAVGGTTLTLDPDDDSWLGETGWSGSGGGISVYERRPIYQTDIANINNPGSLRMTPDISFDADPASGVSVYDSYSQGGASPSIKVGGTSLSSPCWAGLLAIINQGLVATGQPVLNTQTFLNRIYTLDANRLRDITTGSNGNPAGTGYDLVTGLGSPIADNLVTELIQPGGPRIAGTSLPGNSGLLPVVTMDFSFNQVMDTGSFTIASDLVSFTGPGGVDLTANVQNWAWIDAYTLRVGFIATVDPGTYTMVLGSNIFSADGLRAMDQDRDNINGETTDDRYTGRFKYNPFIGPDAFGYRATAHAFENVDLIPGGAGVVTILNNADDVAAAIDLGSNSFSFYGVNYTGNNRLFVSTNGLITFGSGNAVFINTDLKNSPAQPAIAPMWDDWVTYITSIGDADDAVLYQFQDTNADTIPDRLVIEWSNVYSIDSVNSPVTFQAILQLNTSGTPGTITFNYPDMVAGMPGIDYSGGATEGIKSAGVQGGNRLLITMNDDQFPWFGNGKAVIFTPSVLPRVVNTSVPATPLVDPISFIDFKFSRAMDTTSFSIASDLISFTGPDDVNLLPTVTGFSWPDAATLRISFSQISVRGDYSIVIGPQILSAGNQQPMDQDGDNNPGESPDDRYTLSFSVNLRLGPDGFGYLATSYPFENLDLVPGAPGVSSMLDGMDDSTASIDLGTNTFSFYGSSYTGPNKIFVSTNGMISLNSAITDVANGDLTTSPTPATIAPLWDDWVTYVVSVPDAGNDIVLYQFQDTSGDGTPDRLIVEWSNVYAFHHEISPVTFQAILQLNTGTTPGRIIFNYPDLDAGDVIATNGAGATTGIKGADAQGTRRLLISMNSGDFPWVTSGKAILISTDIDAPKLSAEQFQYQTGPAIKMTFNENVAGSIKPSAVNLVNLTTNSTVPTGSIATSYNSSTNTATITFPGYPLGILPDANYRLTIQSGAIFDPTGNPLDGDGDGSPGGTNIFDFFSLGGDANRDRVVNVSDLYLLTTNWLQTGKTFSEGDFNYDSKVDNADLGILAANWLATLPAPPLVSAASLGPTVRRPARAVKLIAPLTDSGSIV